VLEGEKGMRDLLRANFIAAPSLCYRKSLLGTRRFSGDYKFVLDWLLTSSLLLDGDRIVGVPSVGLRYRRHQEQATEQLSRGKARFREEIAFYQHMQPLLAERGWTGAVRIARRKSLTTLHIMYRTLRGLARLDLREARNGIELLRELRT
jgi:hypothetical protein